MNRRCELFDYLRRQHVMTIATTGQDGPWAAPVFYVNEQLRFYFLSAARTQHCRDIAADARVAVTIAGDCAEWSAVKGVQMVARARELSGNERDAARRLYAAKFPGVIEGRNLPQKIIDALEKVGWYELSATRIRLIDNSLGFGHKDEWSAAQLAENHINA